MSQSGFSTNSLDDDGRDENDVDNDDDEDHDDHDNDDEDDDDVLVIDQQRAHVSTRV